jgi:hypothetical protein
MILSNLNLPLPIQSLFIILLSTLVCSQGQTDSIYFDFSNAFGIVPHSSLLHKLSNHRLSSGYLYLKNIGLVMYVFATIKVGEIVPALN